MNFVKTIRFNWNNGEIQVENALRLTLIVHELNKNFQFISNFWTKLEKNLKGKNFKFLDGHLPQTLC